MFVNFPNPDEYVERFISAFERWLAGEGPKLTRLVIERVLRDLQHRTIMDLANALDSSSIKIEAQKRTVTPEDLRQAAGQLRGYATKVEAGDPLPKGPESVSYVQMVEPEPESPSCHVCGALMVPTAFKCQSCGATTGAT